MTRKAQSCDLRVDNALEFHVSRMIAVALIKGPGGRKYTEKSIATVKNRRKIYTDCYGCYIYSVKAGRGFTPIYVGSATEQSLGEEAFTSDKLLKCLQYLAEYKKGSLYITFVAPKNKVDPTAITHRGPCPTKRIQKLEKVLTAVAYRKNRKLINKRNRGLQEFFINGALNSNAGQPRNEVADFKKMIGLLDNIIILV